MKVFKNNIILITLLASILISANIFNFIYSKPLLNISKEDSAINIESTFLVFFNLGLKRLISSSIWLETIIDSDLEHFKSKDGNSWIFHRLLTITRLDPNFKQAYNWGGQYLSVVKDDVSGAKIIYDKGIKKFPNDIWLNFSAGFHYYWELEDCNTAYEIFNKLRKNPKALKRIYYLPSLTARAKACDGDLNTAYFIILQTYKNAEKKSPLRRKLSENLFSIKTEIDLNCLNNDQIKCNQIDFDGRPYILKGGQYFAQKKWRKFRLKSRFRKNN